MARHRVGEHVGIDIAGAQGVDPMFGAYSSAAVLLMPTTACLLAS